MSQALYGTLFHHTLFIEYRLEGPVDILNVIATADGLCCVKFSFFSPQNQGEILTDLTFNGRIMEVRTIIDYYSFTLKFYERIKEPQI